MRRRLPELSWLEGSVPAGSPEEELEEASGKAHERGWLPALHGAGARRLCRHGTNRSRSRGPARGFSSCGCDAVSLHGFGAFRLGETERCIPCGEVMLEAEQERPRHTWGEVVTASLPAPSRKPDQRNFSHLAVVVHFKIIFCQGRAALQRFERQLYPPERCVQCQGLTNSLGGSRSFPVLPSRADLPPPGSVAGARRGSAA